jgi:predicted RNA methylase
VSHRTELRASFDRFVTEVSRARQRGGLQAVVRTSARLIGRQLRRPLDYGREYALDRRHGLDTRGRRKIAEATLERGEHRDGVDFESTPPPSWRKVLRELPLKDAHEFTFVDLGCGKGFVLALAVLHGFGKVIGVELDPELARTARANAAVLSRRTGCPVEIVEGDATNFRLPNEPTVVYMYNPFGPRTMRDVVAEVERSLAAHPRPIFVAYVNPLHRQVWDDAVTLRSISGNRRWALYGPAGARFRNGRTVAQTGCTTGTRAGASSPVCYRST